MLRCGVFLTAALAASADKSESGAWEVLRKGAEAWNALQFDNDFAITVGDASGTLFRWESPGFSSSTTRMAGASLSKWPAAVMISGLVADGTMAYDDLASKHLPWWTTAKDDPRSRVRLHHLLSFTSGYSADSHASLFCARGVPERDQFVECASSLYNNSKHYGAEPGTTWAYLTSHLQFAGAMAVAASGKPIDELFQKCVCPPHPASLGGTWQCPLLTILPVVARGMPSPHPTSRDATYAYTWQVSLHAIQHDFDHVDAHAQPAARRRHHHHRRRL